MEKIVVVGAGRVGDAAALLIAQHQLCRELVLVDRNGERARGCALDIQAAGPLLGFDVRLSGGSTPELLRGADLVIITAGAARKLGMARTDLLRTNLDIIDGIVDDVLRHAPDALLLMVTNPVDVLTYRAWQRTGWERRRVFGQAGILDSARFAALIATTAGCSARDVSAMVIGGHGDFMVALTRHSCIRGVPLAHLLDAAAIERLVERTRHGGAEVLTLRGNSSAYDAPGAAICTMVESIAHDRHRLLPMVSVLQGEYGFDSIAMGVPAQLGAGGMERVVELTLEPGERLALERSAAAIASTLRTLKRDGTEQTAPRPTDAPLQPGPRPAFDS